MLKRAVYLSITSTLPIFGYCPTLTPGAGGLACSSMEYFTSSAVTSLPSWNFTPLRRCQIQVFSSGVSHDSASAGCTLRSLSHSTSESYSNSLDSTCPCEMPPNGTMLTGGTSIPQVSLPPRLAACTTVGAAVAAGPAGVVPGAAGAAGLHAARIALATAAPPTAAPPLRNSRRDSASTGLLWMDCFFT